MTNKGEPLKKNEIYFGAKKTTNDVWETASLRAARRTTIRPRTVHYLEVAAMTDGQVLPPGEEGICEAILGSVLGMWDMAVTTEDNWMVRVAVVNVTRDNLILEAGMWLAT